MLKILNKFFHIDIGKALLIIDFFITFLAAIAFGLDLGFYSMLSVIGLGIAIDRFIDGFNTKKVTILKKKNQVVKKIKFDKGNKESIKIKPKYDVGILEDKQTSGNKYNYNIKINNLMKIKR